MRELLYVSDAKLKHFVDEGLAMRLPKVSGDGEVSMLEALELRFSIAGNDKPSDGATLREVLKRVNRVLKHLDNSEKPPLWFEDQAVHAGDWVQFEGRFSFVDRSGICVFLLRDDGRSIGAPNFLLHGSSRHLISHRAAAAESVTRFENGSPLFHLVEAVPEFLEELRGASSPGNYQRLLSRSRNLQPSRNTSINEMVSEAIGYLRDLQDWVDVDDLVGFARVTYARRVPEMGKQLILASPLYVECA